MISVGVDIGKKGHCVAAINESGEVLLAPWRFDQEVRQAKPGGGEYLSKG